jgi:ABC-2 type transport system permease protein
MHDVLLVALREIRVMLRRPSFYIATFAVPAVTGLLFFGTTFLNARFASGSREGGAAEVKPVGLVDQAAVIKMTPSELHQYFIPYPDEQQAAAALRNNKIDSFFVIAADYQQTGRVVQVSRQVTLQGLGPSNTALRSLLVANLVGDPALARRIDEPLKLKPEIVGGASSAQSADPSGAMSGLSYALGFLLAFGILNGSGWLVQAVAEEKENRTIELLLTSIKPWQLMTGKLLGLGVMSMAQLALWIGLSTGLLGANSVLGRFNVGTVERGVWGWMVIFFVLGFAFFGALMAALGAIGASIRESGQASSFLTLPMLMPLWFGEAIIETPNGMLARVFSLIPFTAPVTIMVRLGQGPVPLGSILASILVMLLAVAGALWLAARLFRSTTLLTGVRPTPRAIWRALR